MKNETFSSEVYNSFLWINSCFHRLLFWELQTQQIYSFLRKRLSLDAVLKKKAFEWKQKSWAICRMPLLIKVAFSHEGKNAERNHLKNFVNISKTQNNHKTSKKLFLCIFKSHKRYNKALCWVSLMSFCFVN